MDEPGFRENYRMVQIELDSFVTAPWVRIDSEALGFQWSDDTVVLPGWFVAHDGRHRAQPMSNGALALTLTGSAEIELPLSSDEWEVVEPSFGSLVGSVLTLAPSTTTLVEKVLLRRSSPER